MSVFFPRGVAISKYPFHLIDHTSGAPITTGTVTVYVSKDGAAQNPAANVPVHNGNGEWLLDITASERDADITALTIIHASSVPIHINIVTDDQLGPGSNAAIIKLGGNGNLANIWITTVADPSTTIANGITDGFGDITFYLNAGTYYVYRQKNGINFLSNPYTIVVTGSATFDLSAYTEFTTSPLETSVYADIGFATQYFSTRLGTSNWDNASSTDQNKALVMATRAINRLAFLGDPTDDALEIGNQFPRGYDTVVPIEIQWACCEEALERLSGETEGDQSKNLRVLSERFSGASVTYDSDNQPDHVRSGIMSVEAWRFITPYLKPKSHIEMFRL